MWYYSPTKNKFIYQVKANTYDFWLSGQYWKYKGIYFYYTPWALFPQKWCVAPEFFVLISPTAVHRFDASDMAVPGLYISWIYSYLEIPPSEYWFQYVRRVYATAINLPCISTLICFKTTLNGITENCLILRY